MPACEECLHEIGETLCCELNLPFPFPVDLHLSSRQTSTPYQFLFVLLEIQAALPSRFSHEWILYHFLLASMHGGIVLQLALTWLDKFEMCRVTNNLYGGHLLEVVHRGPGPGSVLPRRVRQCRLLSTWYAAF